MSKFDLVGGQGGAYAAHRKTFRLWPDLWTSSDLIRTLKWRSFPFNRSESRKIPARPGVYAFVIEPRLTPRLHLSYLIYVGMSEHSIRQRFVKYLWEARHPEGRPKVHLWLNQYSGNLRFVCAATPPALAVPTEDALLDRFLPPANDEFSAELRRLVSAFG